MLATVTLRIYNPATLKSLYPAHEIVTMLQHSQVDVMSGKWWPLQDVVAYNTDNIAIFKPHHASLQSITLIHMAPHIFNTISPTKCHYATHLPHNYPYHPPQPVTSTARHKTLVLTTTSQMSDTSTTIPGPVLTTTLWTSHNGVYWRTCVIVIPSRQTLHTIMLSPYCITTAWDMVMT